MKKKIRMALLLAASVMLLCFLLVQGNYISLAHVRPVEEPKLLEAIVQSDGLEKDRKAILGMLGEYEVTFAFSEFDAAPGYQVRPPKRSDAYEIVVLAEDTGKRIVLQHLLVHRLFGFVLKHWRQDWQYEAPARLEFTSDQTWHVRQMDPEAVQGTWTQCVYEVNDAPRYCGTGKWSEMDGVPTWTSDVGWRPLPRREYSSRDDYNALGVVNIHRITAGGWEHVQNNRKVVREGEREVSTLVKERGVNTYQRITGYDFSSGYDYWNDAKDYWQRVRTAWHSYIDAHGGVKLKYPVDGMRMIVSMYWQAERDRFGWGVGDQEIQDLLKAWVAAPAGGS